MTDGAPAGGQATQGGTESGVDWKAQARTWEQRARADAKALADAQAELDMAKQAQMSESEKA